MGSEGGGEKRKCRRRKEKGKGGREEKRACMGKGIEKTRRQQRGES